MAQIVLLLAFTIPAILFILTQQKTLQAIKPENREMSPRWVWLQVIPLFGQLWQFFVVARISKSIWNEITFRLGDSILGDPNEHIQELNEYPTLKMGITYCVLFTVGGIINLSSHHWHPYWQIIGPTFSITGMICWVIYWVSLSRLKNKIIKMPKLQGA